MSLHARDQCAQKAPSTREPTYRRTTTPQSTRVVLHDVMEEQDVELADALRNQLLADAAPMGVASPVVVI